MSRVEDIARKALAAAGSEDNYILAAQWVANRFSELAGRSRLRSLRSTEPLSTPAEITTDTISVTNGSAIVTGTATAAAAWSEDIVGRHLRVQRVWYKILSYDATALQLVLASPYTEDTDATAGYTIVQRYHTLPADVRHVGDVMVQQRLFRFFGSVDIDIFNMQQPERLLVSDTGPDRFTQIGTDALGAIILELYPYPSGNETFHYVASKTRQLGLRDFVPATIDDQVLIDGVLVDIYRKEMAVARRAGRFQEADSWANEARRQETTWQRRITEARSADRGTDDATLLLDSLHMSRQRYDIATARDEIWARGARP